MKLQNYSAFLPSWLVMANWLNQWQHHQERFEAAVEFSLL